MNFDILTNNLKNMKTNFYVIVVNYVYVTLVAVSHYHIDIARFLFRALFLNSLYFKKKKNILNHNILVFVLSVKGKTLNTSLFATSWLWITCSFLNKIQIKKHIFIIKSFYLIFVLNRKSGCQYFLQTFELS